MSLHKSAAIVLNVLESIVGPKAIEITLDFEFGPFALVMDMNDVVTSSDGVVMPREDVIELLSHLMNANHMGIYLEVTTDRLVTINRPGRVVKTPVKHAYALEVVHGNYKFVSSEELEQTMIEAGHLQIYGEGELEFPKVVIRSPDQRFDLN